MESNKCVCGNALSPGAVFCDVCGKRVSSISENAKPINNNSQVSNNNFTLSIKREEQFFLIQGKVKVFVNGKNNFRFIENGETINLKLPPGTHTVSLQLLFRETSFNINLDKNIQITMKLNRMTGKIDVDFNGAEHSISVYK